MTVFNLIGGIERNSIPFVLSSCSDWVKESPGLLEALRTPTLAFYRAHPHTRRR